MIVYKATSKTTGKVYVGITTNSLEYRKNQHKRAASEGQKNYHFYNAIQKYGFDDFVFEVIEDDITDIKTLQDREVYWIKFYNSYEEGYNSTRGGEGAVVRDDELILKLFIEGLSVQEICEITGYNRNTIYRSFSANNLLEENKQRKNEKTRQRCSMPVLQYTLKGDFIKEWPSATSVVEGGFNQTAVSNVCRQEQLTAYGYIWKYKNDERDIQEWVKLAENKKDAGKPKKPIYQLDEQHNIIAEFVSAADAARAMGKSDKSNICAAARKGCRAYGYYWQYKIDK